MIKLELTRHDVALLMRALKIAKKQELMRVCYAADDLDANEAQEMVVAFDALRITILREAKKGE